MQKNQSKEIEPAKQAPKAKLTKAELEKKKAVAEKAAR